MNVALIISIVAIAVSVAALAFAYRSSKKLQEQRALTEFTAGQIDDLQELLTVSRESIDTNLQRVNEQSRRVAWLEARVRETKIAKSEAVLEAPVVAETPKLNITERRHRVITLASRGQNSETIANTLGMLPGEVELIIGLSQAASNGK